VKLYILKWGAEQRRFASFASLDGLIAHYLENVKNHGENRRFPLNRLLRVKETGVESTRLTEDEVGKLQEAGLMKRVEAA
jgi:hypothetical protein